MAKVLWISWKDIKNPQAGGAELVGHELRKRLVLNGHSVTHLTNNFQKGQQILDIDGVKTIRLPAPRFLYPIVTDIYFSRNLRDKFDIIIEEVNTAPCFISYFKGKENLFLWFHQLTEEVWNYEFSFPFSLVGRYILEPGALFLQKLRSPKVITISQSTKDDLIKAGFNGDNISIVLNASKEKVETFLPKEEDFTVMYYGSMRAMKRPEDVIKAFAMAFRGTSKKLWLSGGADQNRKNYLLTLIKRLGIADQTTWWGRLDDTKKMELLGKASVVSMTSIKEGWGIVVTEAGISGTPAVVYNVDGLRDSVKHLKTGVIVPNGNIAALAQAFISLSQDSKLYELLRKNAITFHSHLTFDNTYRDFAEIIGIR